jgi:CRISPR-associated Cas5-like protein
MDLKNSEAIAQAASDSSGAGAVEVPLTWVRAKYHFHTFCYRDPRSAFSSALGIPVVSPTAVLLGIISTLFSLGRADEAHAFLRQAHLCQVAVDPPNGAIFFRVFHQLRRYISTTKGKTHRAGFTDINQGTKEYALVDGPITLLIGVPEDHIELVKLALRNRDHLGTHDSLCALVGEVEDCEEPTDVLYLPPERWQVQLPQQTGVTILTLSRFAKPLTPTVGTHWWMAGGDNTERVPYLIKGKFFGTSRGKIYRKES